MIEGTFKPFKSRITPSQQRKNASDLIVHVVGMPERYGYCMRESHIPVDVRRSPPKPNRHPANCRLAAPGESWTASLSDFRLVPIAGHQGVLRSKIADLYLLLRLSPRQAWISSATRSSSRLERLLHNTIIDHFLRPRRHLSYISPARSSRPMCARIVPRRL